MLMNFVNVSNSYLRMYCVSQIGLYGHNIVSYASNRKKEYGSLITCLYGPLYMGHFLYTNTSLPGPIEVIQCQNKNYK